MSTKYKNPSVSILTISQMKRQETIKLTALHIDNQTYKNIIEWVIVEGSKTLEDCLINEQFIKNELKCNIPIVYVPGYHVDLSGNPIYNGHHLGELRNISNRTSTGEICVCFDDDDIYFKTRVAHAVNMLTTSKAEIAGCSSKYLYDYSLERLFRFEQFKKYHSTNDAMAYKRTYFENNKNSYDPNDKSGEEAKWTRMWTNPMVQLDPKQTLIGSSHATNTFNKREICTMSFLWKNPENPKEGTLYPHTLPIEETIQDIVDEEMYQKYVSIFNKNEISEFDISYFCGGTSIKWDPTSKSLGGSEQAIIHLCTEWVKMGKKVAVYANITEELSLNGVEFMDWKKFPFHKQHSVVILWRMSGINCGLLFPIKSKKLFADYHDTNFVFRHSYLPFADKIDKIFFKSKFHLDYYQKHFKLELSPDRYSIIPNGLRVSDFTESPGVQRDPYRFCYCSDYTRGLVDLLQYVWPHIHSNEPRAELHVYYGMDYVQDPGVRQKIIFLMGQPGVMDHGRRPVDEIIKEKWKSSFHLYITDCTGEVDCISIRESLITGCVPLISKSGVFAERDGLRFDLTMGYETIAQGVLNLLKKQKFIEMAREQYKKSRTIMDWESVANEWKYFF